MQGEYTCLDEPFHVDSGQGARGQPGGGTFGAYRMNGSKVFIVVLLSALLLTF